jgi:hypothetical protein
MVETRGPYSLPKMSYDVLAPCICEQSFEAYKLDHRNERAMYVANFLNVIKWDAGDPRLGKVMGGKREFKEGRSRIDQQRDTASIGPTGMKRGH